MVELEYDDECNCFPDGCDCGDVLTGDGCTCECKCVFFGGQYEIVGEEDED